MAEDHDPRQVGSGSDDRARLEALVAQYGQRVYAIAYRMTGNPADAQDLAQEAFIRAWRHVRRLDPAGPLEGWFYRTVSNLYIDLLRRRRGGRIQSLDEPLATDAGALLRDRPDPSADVEQSVLDAMVDRRIQDALLNLAPEMRMVVVLADVEGWAYEEIAAMLRVPVGTVKSRLHRARRALRDRLAPLLQEAGA